MSEQFGGPSSQGSHQRACEPCGILYVLCYHLSLFDVIDNIVAEMREKVRQGISGIVGCLNHEDEGLCEAAIKGISSLATYRMYYLSLFDILNHDL